jgi:hypothetical protein
MPHPIFGVTILLKNTAPEYGLVFSNKTAPDIFSGAVSIYTGFTGLFMSGRYSFSNFRV